MQGQLESMTPFLRPAEIDASTDPERLGFSADTIRLIQESRPQTVNVLVYYTGFMAIQLATLLTREYGVQIDPSQCEVAMGCNYIEDTPDKVKAVFRVTILPDLPEYHQVTIAKKPDGTIDPETAAICKEFTLEFKPDALM